jgi:hypothetical protein
MKTIEAIISLMVLLSFSPLLIMDAPIPQTSLQEYQLAEDVWRVAYLKGCFHQEEPDFSALAAAGELQSPSDFSEALEMLTDEGLLDAIESVVSVANAEDAMEKCLNEEVIAEVELETSLRVEFEELQAAGSALPGGGAIKLRKTIIVNGVPRVIHVRVG